MGILEIFAIFLLGIWDIFFIWDTGTPTLPGPQR